MSGLGKGIYVLPNLFTSANLFLGFYAIIQAVEITMAGENTFKICAFAVILAAIADMLDGRVANMTKSASKFGVEFDSLSDLVSFGVAPALVMYLWALQSFGPIGSFACFLYLGCTAVRLARYNVQESNIEKTHFQGLPSPMAAFMLCGLMLIFNGKELADVWIPYIGIIKFYVLGLVILLSILMVSNIQYRKFKSLFVQRHFSFYLCVSVAVIVVMVLAIDPLWTIFLTGLIYVLSGVIMAPVRLISTVTAKLRV